MYIKKILLNNYKIYHQQNVVEFEKNDIKNISIISGYNGFGKTTFLTSLVWCIYGKHMQEVQPYFKDKILQKGGYTKYLKSSLNHKANSDGVNNFFVELTLTNVSIPGLGCDEVVLKRSYKMGDKSDHLQIFIDKQDNELVKEIGNEIFIQDFLLPKEIAKFFFFDAERITSIAEISTIEDKRNLSKAYTEVLGIKKYEDLRDNLIKTQLKYAKESASKSDKKALSDYENSIYQLKIQLNEINASVKNNDETKDLLTKKAEDLQFQLIREGSALTITEINKLRKRKETLIVDKKEISSSYKELLNILPFALNLELLSDIQEQSEKEGSSNDISNTLLKTEFTDLEERILAVLSNTSIKKEIKSVITNKLKEIEQTDVEIIHDLTNNESLGLFSLINNIKTNYLSRVKEINRLVKINNSERNKIVRMLSNAETKNKDKVVESIRKEKRTCLAKLEIINDENIKKHQQIGMLSNQLNAKQSSFKELSKKVKISENLIKKDKLTNRLVNQLDVFILKIKNTKKVALEKRILDSLHILMHKKSFVNKVEVKISNDIIDIELFSSRGIKINKEDFSEGEKQLYATSLLKALVEESNIKFPVFVDSPLQKFDEQHTENVITKFYPSISDQVVIFPLLNKELSESDYNKIKNRISNTIVINNKDEDSSELVKVNINDLFKMNEMLNNKVDKYV